MDLTVFGIDVPFWSGEDGTTVGGAGAESTAGPAGIRPLVVLAVVVGLAFLARFLRRSGATDGESPSA